jgi:glycosyltransferase involved in cell wall biosynthesis
LTRPFALTAYPLSQAFRDQLEGRFGKPDYVSLPELRRLPPTELLRRLASFRGRPALLPLEDETSSTIRPILHAVATLAFPSSIEVVRLDLERERLRARQLMPALGALLTASLQGQIAAARARNELRRLGALARTAARFGPLDRVFYLNANLWFGLKAGGSVGHLAGVVNGFAAGGRSVDLVSATDPILLRPEVHYERLTPPRAFGVPLELNFFRFQSRVVSTLARRHTRGYGFLYQRMSVLNYAGVVLSRRLGLPLVLEYNGSEVWAARHWGRPLRYERLAQEAEDVSLHHAHVVVTVSEVLRDALIKRGVEPARFGPDELLALRRRHGISPDAVVATFIGTFGHWHGVDVLARVIARLVQEDEGWLRERRLHFMLVGDGLRMAEVRELLRDPAIAPYVTLTGLVPQADGPLHLAAADLLLSPHVPNPDGTPFFGSPTKLFEYMASGRPIVASDLDQIGAVLTPALEAAELPTGAPPVADPHVAVLATPGDEETLLEGIRFLVERPDWRLVLGQNARTRVLDRYTWHHHVEAIIDRIRRVAEADAPVAVDR